MSVKTEVSLMMEPIWEWGASVDRQALVWWLLVVVAVIVLRKPLAHWILKILAKSLRALSVRPPDNVQIELETSLRVIIVCVAFLLAVEAVQPPAFIGYIIEKLALTVMVVAVFAAWYKLAADFIAVLNHKQPDNVVTDMDWSVRVTRFVIILLGIAAVLELWQIDVSAVLTGVGVFGAALVIALQDMVRNLFGGMSNVREKRFVTGEWIKVEGVVEGLVKEIDLRSTTIIGFDRVPRYVPNADLANATVQNLSRRDHRRVNWMVPLVLSATTQQVEDVCTALRRYLTESDDFVVRDDILCLVQVAGMSASAVEVKIYAFTKVNAYADYLAVCERLTACIRQTVDQFGTSLAYPTRSLILEKSDGNSVGS
jgi:MscS family membrane protein